MMQKLMYALLVGTIALTPAIAAAQAGSGTGGTGSSPSGTSSSPGTSAPSSGGATTAPGAGGSSTSPSASPSGSGSMGSDFSKFHTKADCEKAGGMWQTASSSCMKK